MQDEFDERLDSKLKNMKISILETKLKNRIGIDENIDLEGEHIARDKIDNRNQIDNDSKVDSNQFASIIADPPSKSCPWTQPPSKESLELVQDVWKML